MLNKREYKEFWRKSHFLPKEKFDSSAYFEYFTNVSKYYTAQVFETVYEIFCYVMEEDWDGVRRIISTLDFCWDDGPYKFLYFRRKQHCYGLHMPQIFYAAFQCLLESNLSKEVLARKLINLAYKFGMTNITSSSLVRKTPAFYLTEVLICMNAWKLLDVSDLMKEVKLLSNVDDIEYSTKLKLYNLIGDYLRWVRADCLDDLIANDLIRYLLFFLEGSEEPYKYLLLLTPFVHVSKKESTDSVMRILRKFCDQTPWVLPYIARILVKSGLEDLKRRLVEEVLPFHPELFGFHLVIEYIAPRTESPSSFGNIQKVAKENIQQLFVYLDYGRNRTDEIAWRSLELNLLNLKIFPKWLCELWEERKSWWPKFHSRVDINISEEGLRARGSVLLMMMALNVN